MADLIIYNGSDKVIKRIVELLNQGGGGGQVDDVKVNGTSVVDENKVAQIDLSDYATQSYVTSALNDYTTTAVLQANYYNKTEVNSRLADKADATSVYTKSEVNTALQGKADASTTYTKTEVDTALQSKANANSVYTKTEADTLLSAKANASDVYTKTETYSDDEVDALLSTKANTADLATVNDGTLTLKNGDQTKGTFSANQSTAANVVILPFDITGNTTIGFTPVYPS